MNYNIYMLRVWKEDGKNNPNPLRVSIENPQTGTRVGFTDWDSLLTFLSKQNDGFLTKKKLHFTDKPALVE